MATLLSHSLGEEESSDHLLTELTKPILQQASWDDGHTVAKKNKPVKAKA